MIFFSMLTGTIGSQSRPNNIAAANFLCLHFVNNRSSIQSFFFSISVPVPKLRQRHKMAERAAYEEQEAFATISAEDLAITTYLHC